MEKKNKLIVTRTGGGIKWGNKGEGVGQGT